MALSPDDRKDCTRRMIERIFVRSGTTANMTVDEILAAVNAADDWLETVAATYNLALPVAFRTKATARQKAMLLASLCMKRAGAE